MKYRYRPKRNDPYFTRKRIKKGPSILGRVPFVNELRAGRPGRNGDGRSWLSWLFMLAAVGTVAGAIGVGIVFAWVSRDLPDPNRLLSRDVEKTTKIWDRTGEHLLYEIHGDEKRTIVELNDIAPVMIHATLASEDRNFYEHRGFQLKSFVRAALTSFRHGGRAQGTSTITQQLIKNAILSNERTLTRKAKELILSYQIERKFTKDDILKLYFNEIPYGSVSYGIEAAARSYFGKSASELDAAESAVLAALPKAPSRLSPYGSHTDELLWWQRFILDTMVEDGYLSHEEAEEAKSVDVLARVRPRFDSIEAAHFSLYVKELLAAEFGEREVETGGLNVITTLDHDMQKAAEEAVSNGMEIVRQYEGSNAALVAIDPKTGQVMAMVGSADYFDDEIDGQVNVTVRARQPGSSIKPVAYAAAFEKGFTPDTILFDVNTQFATGGTPYEPKNYDLSEHGPVTIRTALAGSLNIPAVKALYLAGLDDTLALAARMGYTTLTDKSRFGLSMVLGGGEVRPIEHAAAFGVFATEGVWRAPTVILKVEDASGNVIKEWKDEPKEGVMDVQTARNINAILSDNAARAYVFGERNHLTLGARPAAAKTGTTNNFHDAWTVGYTPDLVAAVWTGNNDNAQMRRGADGSRLAAPIWNAFMKTALDGRPTTPFNPPDKIETGKPVFDGQAGETVYLVDKYSGKLASENTPPEAVVEKVYREAHSILYYVDPKDPRGPRPADPSKDPQFENWERAVLEWAERENWATDEAPPTEVDDLHDPEFAPSVSFLLPEDNAEISGRTLTARVQATAPRGVTRVEYRLEGVLVGTSTSHPWDAVLIVPDIFDRGFYTLRATAFDDVDHNASQEITVNVQSDGRPLSVEWLRPSADIGYRATSFPVYIDARLTENRGVELVEIFAAPAEGEAILIGRLRDPSTHGVSTTWSNAPGPGTYTLRITVHLAFGERRTYDGPEITVK